MLGAQCRARHRGNVRATYSHRPVVIPALARLIFVLLLAVALVISLFRAHYSFSSPPSFVQAIGVFMLLLTGAIVAMSFLPPVRDCFAKNEA
jgi:hypothetical protein